MTATNWLDDNFLPPGDPVESDGTGTLNNVAVTKDGIRFTGVAPTVTGLAGGKPGRRVPLLAVGGPLVLANESGSSAAANRIVTGTGANVTINEGSAAELVYDDESKRWRLASNGGGTSATVADDVGKTGLDIDRVKGFLGVPFKTEAGAAPADLTKPPVGGTWVYNERESVEGLRPKKPSPPGHYDVTNYGAIADWGCGRTCNTTNGSATATAVTSTAGLKVGQKMAIRNVSGVHVIQSIGANTITFTAPLGATTTGSWIVTDNLDAFNAAMNAIRNDASFVNKASKIIADGPFFLSDTWHLYGTVVVEGSGAVYYSQEYTPAAPISYAGTLLVFPKNVDGVFIHSGAAADSPTQFADHTALRELNVACCDDTTTSGHGIVIRTRAFLYGVIVQAFGGDGFHIEADTGLGTGNASGFYLEKCISGINKGHGFNIFGGDANIGVIIACDAQNNVGYGFRDRSGLGNTYIGCHAEGNDGDVGATVDLPGFSTGGGGGTGDGYNHDYFTDLPTNCSVFVGCYAEVSRNYVKSPAMIIGGLGLSAEGANKPDLAAFVLGHGVPGEGAAMSGSKLLHRNNRDGVAGVQVTIGADVDDTNVLSFSPTDTSRAETDTIYVRKVDNSFYLAQAASRILQMWPYAAATPRVWTTYYPNGIMYGYVTEGCRWHYAATTPPTNQRDGATPYTYLSGDIIWNTDRDTNPHILAWRCKTGGTIGGAAVFEIIPSGVAPSRAMGALDVDWSIGSVFTKTLASGANTITFSNAADGMTIIVILTSNAGGSTVTWPTVLWAGGTPPTQSTPSKVDVYTFVKAGSTIYGSVSQDHA